MYQDWCSANLINSYIQIDFREPFVYSPTSYTFVTRPPSHRYGYNPMSWVVQGKIGNNWENISEVDESSFNYITSQTFYIDTFTENLNSIRFLQTSINSKGNDPATQYVFCLSELEIFGIIRKGLCIFSINCNIIRPFGSISFTPTLLFIR